MSTPKHLNPQDIEAMERATVAAVAPGAIAEHGGWLLPFDAGPVNRAKSAVPLLHREQLQPDELIQAIEQIYRERGGRAAFRLADLPCFAGMQAALADNGYQRAQPTLVQTAASHGLRAMSGGEPAMIENAPASVHASVRENGRVTAAGAATFSHGWCCIHSLQTDPPHRGRGHAGRVLAALGQAALERHMERVFLQVEQGNMAAQSLYAKAGFTTAWAYEYWRRPA